VLQVRRMTYRMLGEKVQVEILRCGVGFCMYLFAAYVVENERPKHSRQYQLSPYSAHRWLHSFLVMEDAAWWHLACGGVPLKLLLVCNRVLYCTALYCTVLYCTVLYCTCPRGLSVIGSSSAQRAMLLKRGLADRHPRVAAGAQVI